MPPKSSSIGVAAALAASIVPGAFGQTFQRLGGCPSLGCVLPPDQSDFLAGQLFDLRLEVHAPVNGSEAYNGGVPDEGFSFCIQASDGECRDVADFFGKEDPEIETWSFEWFEDLYAADDGKASQVNVASKIYRALTFSEPGDYIGLMKYYNGHQTVANWHVRPVQTERKAKNMIFFVGDGMAPTMISAARLLGHKSINGRYQTMLAMDQMEALGHQLTNSIDSFITDSANSATSLFAGIKSNSGALNVQADSSANSFDDPKRETFAELFQRTYPNGKVGIISTANIADATPAAVCTHTRDRGQYATIVDQFLRGSASTNETFEWPTGCVPDVLFGGGAELFLPGDDFDALNGNDYYGLFSDAGYNVAMDNSSLAGLPDSEQALGVFSISHLPVWLDRNVYPDNLAEIENSPTGDDSGATDPPGLKEMTLKGIDILNARSKAAGDEGFVLMSEAASIDKQAHGLDYDRCLGDLLELDDTIRATLLQLEELGIAEETLVVVTADHGHGFDVFGNVDTKYLKDQEGDRMKRSGIGLYERSGLSGYQATSENPTNNTVLIGEQGPGFPVNWDPRYAAASGFVAGPDHRNSYTVNKDGPRQAAVEAGDAGYIVNPEDQPKGFVINGTIPTSSPVGVHSLTDVAVFASGPGAHLFRGVYDNLDIFYKVADALALGNFAH